MNKNKSFAVAASLAIIVTVLGIGAIIGTILWDNTGRPRLVDEGENGQSTQQVLDLGADTEFSKSTHSVEDVAQKISPSVVSIIGTGSNSQSSVWDIVSFTQNAGTGVIVSKDGYIITNKHVIEGKYSIAVTTNDGRVFEDAKVAATDPLNDLAFLKLEGVDDLTPAELGDSKILKVGQEVVAFGNALGQYQNTVTAGIISGMDRDVTAANSSGEVEALSGMIQTDAAINSGNSGGPLVNSRGQVIGINTAKSEQGDGIGFAIPISAAKGILKSLVSGGKGERAVLGVNYSAITPQIARSQNLSTDYGALISKDGGIVAGGPAAKAGLKNGDIITHIAGAKIGEAGPLLALISEYSAGETISITVISNGETRNIDVTLEAYRQ